MWADQKRNASVHVSTKFVLSLISEKPCRQTGRFRKQRVTVMRTEHELAMGSNYSVIIRVGVVGGLISVYFIVLEIRRNAQATEGATVQSLMSMEKDVFGLLANNAGLYLRGCEDISKLSAEEKF